jgi:DNA-directed RNA polymerase specialized sigma24 family protein
MVRLRDTTKAEDAVQETFLVALKGRRSFAGRSAEKSWLVGILKNKICDY